MKGSITMKKAISILLVLSVIICGIGSAIAEDFSVRNGIQFGMSVDEVKKIEKDNGLDDNDMYLDGLSNDGTWYQVAYITSIAGIEDSRVIYKFDKDSKKLAAIDYNLGSNLDDETALSLLLLMKQNLADKYGEPIHSSYTDGTVFPIVSDILMTAQSLLAGTEYYEWLVKHEDYYVLIDDVYMDLSWLKGGYFCHIGYQYVSATEAESKIQELVESAEEQEKKTKEETNRDL